MHPTNAVPCKRLEKKVLPQVETELLKSRKELLIEKLSFSIIFHSHNPAKRKSHSKPRFFSPPMHLS